MNWETSQSEWGKSQRRINDTRGNTRGCILALLATIGAFIAYIQL